MTSMETSTNERATRAAVADAQTADDSGRRIVPEIDGVTVRAARTVVDSRGELTELFATAWYESVEPVAHAYLVVAAPGSIRGWVVHDHQDDHLTYLSGRVRVVLYDARTGSPTEGVLAEHYFGSNNRCHLIIPAGVFHLVQNVGTEDALFTNHPSRPYRHDAPDKRRLPVDTDLIPYTVTR